VEKENSRERHEHKDRWESLWENPEKIEKRK
jgi:hypothetical protein